MSNKITLADVEQRIQREQRVAQRFGIQDSDTYATDSGPRHRCGSTLWIYKVTGIVNNTRAVFAKCASCGRNDRANIEIGDEDFTVDDLVRAHEEARD